MRREEFLPVWKYRLSRLGKLLFTSKLDSIFFVVPEIYRLGDTSLLKTPLKVVQ
jgi:hypothetical protein